MFYEYVLSFLVMLMLVSIYVYFLSVSFTIDVCFMCMSVDITVTATDMCAVVLQNVWSYGLNPIRISRDVESHR